VKTVANSNNFQEHGELIRWEVRARPHQMQPNAITVMSGFEPIGFEVIVTQIRVN
jgi:hypothetical protein